MPIIEGGSPAIPNKSYKKPRKKPYNPYPYDAKDIVTGHRTKRRKKQVKIENARPNIFDTVADIANQIGKNVSRTASKELDRQAAAAGSDQHLYNQRPSGGGSRNRPAPRTGGGAAQRGTDQLDQLFQTLMSQVGGQSPNFDMHGLLEKNLDAINNAYDAERNAVLSNNKRARKVTASQRQELEGMYSALSRSYGRQQNQAEGETRQDVRQTGNIYDRQSKSARRVTNAVAQDQANAMNQLGIGVAGEATIPDQYKDLTKELSRVRDQKSEAQRGAKSRGNTQENYLGKQKGLALETGYQASTDALQNLQDYIFQNRQQLQQIAGERGQAKAQAKTELGTQLAGMQQDYQNDVWDRLMDVAGFKLDVDAQRADTRYKNQGLRIDRQGLQLDRNKLAGDLSNMRFDNAQDVREMLADQQASSTTPQDILGDTAQGKVSQILNSQLGTKQSATKTMGVFNNFIAGPTARRGFITENGEKRDMTPEDAAAMALNMGRRQGLQGQQLRALQLAVLDYFGR